MSSTTLYTAKIYTTSGREGSAISSDGALDVRLSSPGSNRPGTNPEQLFAAGWSACFLSAIGIAASERKLRIGADATVDAEVDLVKGDDGYSLAARLHVNLPGIDRDVVEALIERAHQTCPYSKAIHSNIKVVTTFA
jgi:lipoyl-dependent peroxiredoxin